MRVEVVRAGEEDWERYRALRLSALAETPDAFGTKHADERDRAPSWWRQRLGRVAITLFARLEERDAGLCVVAPAEDGAAGLYSVWVAPEARGRGAGDALIGAAVREAREAGYRRMVLDVGDHNLPAMRLYRRWGFLPTGRTSKLPPPREHVTETQLARDL